MATLFINGKGYDISSFDHPGNEVIYEYEGRDATDVFNAFHPTSAYKTLHSLPRVSKQLQVDEKLNNNEFEKDIRAVHFDMLRNGQYKANLWYYCFVVFRNLLMLSTAFYLPPYLSCISIAMYMVHSGWISHDICHNQVFKERWMVDIVGGYLFGCLSQGFSSTWWKNKHNTHHASPNVEDHDPDINTAPLLAWSASLLKKSLKEHPVLSKALLSYQHLLFFPLLVVARWSWCFQSILVSIKDVNIIELTFLAVHWYCKYTFSMQNGCYLHFFATEAIASILLSFVFSLNHNPLPTLVSTPTSMGFYEHQAQTSQNYSGGRVIDFFTGGLSYQIEHHVL